MVDNFQFGRTASTGDLRIPLPPASYDIRLEKPGFQALKVPVKVLKDQESQISVKLEREVAPSFVVANAVPGATVRVDGREVGVVQPDGTFKHEGTPGVHNIELEKAGYTSASGKMELVVGSTTSVGIGPNMQPAAATAEAASYAAIADSTDPSALQQFLQKYPSGKNATQVRNRLEDLDWKNVNRTDLTSLDAFLRDHPASQHANEARGLVAEGQAEIAAYLAAETAGTPEALQTFVTQHPNGPHADQARQKLSQLANKDAVLGVLRRYEEAYNRKDLGNIVELYPSCPEGVKKIYRENFHSAEPQRLKLELEDPEIQGIVASVKGKEVRTGPLNSSTPFTAKLMKQGDKWIIQSGIY